MISRADARANAGSLAAASVVVSKQVPLRDPLLAGLAPRFRPSSLGDLPRLFSQDDATPADRLARLSAAALVYSVDKSDKTQAEKVLRDDERSVLDALHLPIEQRRNDRSCPHCHLLLSTLYGDRSRWRQFPPIGVVNHQARVEIFFDPETNISEASIKKFQVIVPKAVATKLISLSHPLHWAETAVGLFRRSDAVEADGSPGEYFGNDRATIETMWEKRASAEEAFIFEDVGWPINDQLSADSENVIKVFDFKRTDDCSLTYQFALERCIRTNFGIAWEPSGLDIDGGEFSASAVPLDGLFGTSTSAQGSAYDLLLELTRRDILGLEAQQNASIYDLLARGWAGPEDDPDGLGNPENPELFRKEVHFEKLNTVARRFAEEWKDFGPFYLLEVSASKRLHFTIPEVSPIDLWQNLTYSAPAILFTFLNRAVCQAPHLLIEDIVPQNGAHAYAAGV
jgi:hypothetical protein